MGFVFVACWMLACVDLLCFGSFLEVIFCMFWELVGSIFGVLGACWGQFSLFWELVGLIFGA